MSQHPERDALRPMLQDAESDLAHRLEEACAMHHVQDESTGELMRLEETLLDAARAAKQAVSVRRRLRALEDGARSADGDGSAAESVRDFVDEGRVEWRVWEVIPGRTRASSRNGKLLGELQAGWLAFEAVGGGQRRRLRDYPRDWNKLSNDALEGLLRRADPVREAARRSSGARERPDSSPRP